MVHLESSTWRRESKTEREGFSAKTIPTAMPKVPSCCRSQGQHIRYSSEGPIICPCRGIPGILDFVAPCLLLWMDKGRSGCQRMLSCCWMAVLVPEEETEDRRQGIRQVLVSLLQSSVASDLYLPATHNSFVMAVKGVQKLSWWRGQMIR